MKNKLGKFFANIDYMVQPVFMVSLLLAALFQVLYRFVPFIKAPWTLELIKFLFSGSVWLGISIAIKEDAHVGIKAVYRHFPLRIRKALKIFSHVVFGLMMIIFGWLGTEALLGYAQMQTLTPAMHQPYWLMRMPIVLGSILSVYRLIQEILNIIKNKDPEFLNLGHESDNKMAPDEYIGGVE